MSIKPITKQTRPAKYNNRLVLVKMPISIKRAPIIVNSIPKSSNCVEDLSIFELLKMLMVMHAVKNTTIILIN